MKGWGELTSGKEEVLRLDIVGGNHNIIVWTNFLQKLSA